MLITIPLYIILFLYLIFLAIFAVFSLINIYHIVMSASFTLASFVITFFVFILTVLTLFFTWYLLQDVYWQTPILIFNLDWAIRIFDF
jgi:hypothetical protein